MKTFIIRTLIVFGFIYVMLASIIISITHLYQSDFSDKVALEYGYKEHDIEGIQNQSSLFYFTALNNQINYRFGRNMSGAYNFNIIPPIYQGETEGSLIQGERYQYTMYLKEYGVEDWFDPKYELPELDSEGLYTGKYFFILSQTTRPITREFAIVIKPITQSGSWGLNDENTSWDQQKNKA